MKHNAMGLEDGSHEGTITSWEETDKGFAYLKFFISVDDVAYDVRYSCPISESPNSKLGRLLSTFGVDVSEGTEINNDLINDTFVDKRVRFMSVTNNKGFTDVVDDSLKPL